jgi:hypothetical protein
MRRILPLVLLVFVGFVSKAAEKDMAISRLIFPKMGVDLNATEEVRVEIENKGTLEASGFTVAL